MHLLQLLVHIEVICRIEDQLRIIMVQESRLHHQGIIIIIIIQLGEEVAAIFGQDSQELSQQA